MHVSVQKPTTIACGYGHFPAARRHTGRLVTVRFLAGSDEQTDGRTRAGALAAAVLRAHVKTYASADACGDDSDVRRQCTRK